MALLKNQLKMTMNNIAKSQVIKNKAC